MNMSADIAVALVACPKCGAPVRTTCRHHGAAAVHPERMQAAVKLTGGGESKAWLRAALERDKRARAPSPRKG
jgi:hypothetical protein